MNFIGKLTSVSSLKEVQNENGVFYFNSFVLEKVGINGVVTQAMQFSAKGTLAKELSDLFTARDGIVPNTFLATFTPQARKFRRQDGTDGVLYENLCETLEML